ncbi:MAG: hypothetical protein ACTS6P_01430 [Candidatus Hodgkinia cicadicola]
MRCNWFNKVKSSKTNKLINQNDVIVRRRLNNLSVKTYYGSYGGAQSFFEVLS